ncbi:MAG: NADH:flavin oxidoreductase, partial [Planctomycetota bacterium]|nr:NADH:flavin oxidoreductase [Planctomycetota bacterium]
MGIGETAGSRDGSGFPKLFGQAILGGRRVKNRLVFLPIHTFSFQGEDGDFYGRRHVEHYLARARGGVGIIIVQATRVFGAAAGTEAWTRGSREALGEIAGGCRERGALPLIQLSGGDLDINALSTAEVESMQSEMRAAAFRAGELGFAGVEYHFAHGFTFCKFLDAAHNKRRDEFGGEAENRIRLLTGILPEIRRFAPPGFIVAVRMGARQPEPAQGLAAARLLEKAGVDLLDITFGMEPPAEAEIPGFAGSALAHEGCRVKRTVGIPVIAVGGIRSGEQARYLVENGLADFAGVGRALLADPEFPNRVANGQPVNRCRNCGECRWFTDHRKCPALAGTGPA